MKVYKKSPIKTLLIVTLLLVGFSQNNVHAQSTIGAQLTGSWLFNDQVSFTSIDPMFKAQLDTIPALRAKFMAVYSGRKLTFASNGNYTTTLSDGRSSVGSWTVQGNDIIQVIDPSGTVYQYRLGNLSASTLTLIPIVAPDSKSMITQWHFNKL